MLYAKRFATGEPTIEVFGKPTISTFDYARRLLEERYGVIRLQQQHKATSKIERIYMVGGMLQFSQRLLSLLVEDSDRHSSAASISSCFATLEIGHSWKRGRLLL